MSALGVVGLVLALVEFAFEERKKIKRELNLRSHLGYYQEILDLNSA